ncbi:hypothetical protein NC652_034138 [Populus alba x Populus x berolinensis]|nr:hypothetical protein NC652_034138 [Populus alba x Populus x berolinensis]
MTKFSSDAKDSYISLIQEAPFQRNWPVCASGNNFMDKKRSRATTTLLTFIIDSGTSFQKPQLIDPKPAIIAPRQYNFSPIKGEEDMEELAIAMPRRPLKLDSSKALASLSLCLPISAMSKIMNREARVSTELLSKTILLFPLA